MSLFYILNDAPTIDATTAHEAARNYALANDIVGGVITVASNVKAFNVVDIPKDIQVTDV